MDPETQRTLITAVSTLVAALAGSSITQVFGMRLDRRRWTRERDREKELWRREDEQREQQAAREAHDRILDQRHDAYLDFLATADRGLSAMEDDEAVRHDWLHAFAGLLDRVRLYGSDAASLRAANAYDAVVDYAMGREEFGPAQDERTFLFDQIRKDLGIPK